MADKRQNNDLIVDFETMGQDESNCAVIDCAALFFEWKRFTSNKPYSFEELLGNTKRFKLNVKHQVVEHNYVVEPETIQFWQTTDPETRARIAPQKDDLTVEQFTTQFIDMLASSRKVDYWWSRSNNFDPPIIWRLMRRSKRYHDFNQYVMFHRLRDVRTFIDAKFDFETVNGFVPISDERYWATTFKPHNSQHDVAADVMRLQAITRAENDMEQVTR
jgi:hypothetical protein